MASSDDSPPRDTERVTTGFEPGNEDRARVNLGSNPNDPNSFEQGNEDATRLNMAPGAAPGNSNPTRVVTFPPDETTVRSDAPRAPAADMPAHLKLPDVSAQGAAAQLPSFPSVDIAAPPPPRAPPPRKGPPPPPRKVDRPPPPPRGRRARQADDMSLPELMGAKVKRNLTLVALQLPEGGIGSGRLVWPFVLLIVGVGGAVAAWALREKMFSVGPAVPAVAAAPAVVLSAREQANLEFASGAKAFDNKDYGAALRSFEKALVIDPTFADAHRSIGIVYATTHEQGRAVEAYKKYLEQAPNAPDAGEVKKIVDDYAQSQVKSAATSSAASAPAADDDGAANPAKGKRAKGKRRGKH